MQQSHHGVGPRITVLPGAAALLLLACQPQQPATQCTEQEDCPDGYLCDDERWVCVPEDGTPDLSECGSMGIFRSDFGPLAPEVPWRCSSNGPEGDAFTIELPVNERDTAYWPGCVTAFSADLRGTSASVSILETPDQSGPVRVELSISEEQDQWVSIVLQGGMLSVDYELEGTTIPSLPAPIAFDPVRHSRWRVREVGGVMFLEVSDGSPPWTELGHLTTLPWTHRSYIWIGGEVPAQHLTASTLLIDDLNTDLDPDEVCLASAMTDDFTGGARAFDWRLDPDWAPNLCSVGEQQDQLQLQYSGPGANGVEKCDLTARVGCQLRDSEVVVQVTEPPGPGMLAGILIQDHRGRLLRLGLADGQLHAFASRGWQQDIAVPAPEASAGRRWLRVRQEAYYTYFEARAAPGDDWEPVWDTPDMPMLEAAVCGLTLRVADPSQPPQQLPVRARFDNYNLP